MRASRRVEARQTTGAVGISISRPLELYAELERIARTEKVSLARVVPKAAEKYVVGQWLLLAKSE